MGSFSVNSCCLHFHVYTHNSSFSKQAVHCSRKSHMAREISLKSSASKKYSFDSLHGLGSSNLMQKPSYYERIAKFLAEMGVRLVFGSLVFLGSFNVKPALGSPTQMSANVEEENATVDGLLDDDEMCVKLLQQEPRNTEALKVILNAKLRTGKINEALKYAERLIDIEPDEVEWRLLQALCYEMVGKLSEAKRLFEEILKERPLLLRALHGLATVMHKNHDGPAVFDMLDKALELAVRERRVTEERNILILIAQMHVVKGELDEGLKMFQSLIDENPRDFRPYLCQGVIYSLQDKRKEAEDRFEIYQSLVPEEFPQRGFLDDVMLTAKTESGQQLERELEAAYSYKK